jgi:ribonuclease G
MSKELVVSASRHETRIAILEDDSVVEIFYQREKEYSLAGSIHKGKVTRVLPGMQSAFVDIGLERDAVLYVSDFFEDNEEYDKVVSSVEEKVLKLDKSPSERPLERPAAGELPTAIVGEEEEAEALVETTNGEAESIAVEGVGTESRSTEVRQEREPRPDRDARGDRDSRDRGGRGRGRRGRRRRGGPPTSLPESKFYSPRREAEPATEPTGFEPTVEPDDEEFPVLPGESLAKYSAGEGREQEESDAIPEAAPVLDDSESEAGEIKIEVVHETTTQIPEPPPVPEAGAKIEPPIETPPDAPVIPAVHDEVPIPEPVVTPEPEATPQSEPESKPEPQAEVEPLAAAEVSPDGDAGDEAEIAAEEAAASEEGSDETSENNDETAETEEVPVIEEEEGPEPARIPTSLTAALREQGNRFPHRLSRRARRKMRGGGGKYEAEPRTVPAVDGNVAEPIEGSAEVPPAPIAEVRQPRERGERRDRPERGERGERAPRADRGERGEGERERSDRPERAPRAERHERGDRTERERPVTPSISELLREGQEIIVQIAKEPLGQKGARITSHIALPGRFLVYMPTVDHVGVSRKIPSDEERQRLKRILQTNRTGMTGGFIVRTAGEGKTEEELRADMHFLYNLWLDIRQKAEKKPAPLLLHHDLDLVQRILRDQLTSSFKTIWVDHEEVFEGVLRFVQRFQPALVNRVKLYTRTNPIFDEFNVTAELEKALRPKVWLKSGGYIVINQTEALVAIDVNTGKYVGKSNRLEDTIVRVNTDAIKEIVRQIRLRDLGGIIVVDFIDMDERKNRQKVMQALEEAMRADRAPYKILAFNDFGLVAITRKRVKQSLERTLCSPCPSCEGAGYIKSVQTVVGEILQEAQKMAKLIEGNDVLLRVNPEVAKVLKSNRNDFLQELEETLGRTVMVKSDPTLHQTKFDLA